MQLNHGQISILVVGVCLVWRLPIQGDPGRSFCSKLAPIFTDSDAAHSEDNLEALLICWFVGSLVRVGSFKIDLSRSNVAQSTLRVSFLCSHFLAVGVILPSNKVISKIEPFNQFH